ncbi:MAG TPA: hypothetical protein VMV19_11010 [Xanthobacteraceae bacterium]|nr:hypothetical protein [Xanthobacteraceae bacterium]
MRFLLEITSAGFAVIAAMLWLRSAVMKTPKQFSIDVHVLNEPSHLVIGPTLSSYAQSPELNDLGKAVIKQSRWSAAAACSAAIAAILQAIIALQDQPWLPWLK